MLLPVADAQQDRLEYQNDTSVFIMSGLGTNRALGAFLRSRRERLNPVVLGLSTIRRRRTPGLRREEVAEAAGISVEWYVKLEQGRAVAPPAATVEALARALNLDRIESAHLRRLAGAAVPEVFARETMPTALRRLVQGLPFPAYITGQRFDVLAWNTAATAVFGDFGRVPSGDRNMLVSMLTRPSAKTLFGAQWQPEARRMVALFRANFDLWASDPAFIDLVEQLHRDCDAFEGWWRAHDVTEPVSGVKILHLPDGGRRFEYSTFQANDDPALKLAIYSPC